MERAHGANLEDEARVQKFGEKLKGYAEKNYDAGLVQRAKNYLQELWHGLRIKFGVGDASDYDAIAMRMLRKMHPESEFQRSIERGGEEGSLETRYQPGDKRQEMHPDERLVVVARPDGSTYHAAFADKYYDWPGRGKVESIAIQDKNGNWTHKTLPEGDRILKGRELNAPENQPLTTEDTKDAIQESSTRGLLPREQGQAGEAGSERSGMGQGNEGAKATEAGGAYQTRYQGERKHGEEDILKPGTDVVSKYVGGMTRSAIDNIRKLGVKSATPVANAFDKTLIESRQRFGQAWSKIDAATAKLSTVQANRVDYVLNREVNMKRSQEFMLKTAAERGAYRTIRAALTEQAAYHEKIGEPIYRKGGPTKLVQDPWYYPTTHDLRAGDIIRQNENPEAIEQYHQDYLKQFQKFNSGATPADAEHAWVQHVDSIQGSAKYGIEPNLAKYGAQRREAGTPLPDSMRRTNLRENLFNYFRRSAMDNAMYHNIESDPKVAAALGFHTDAWGNKIDTTGIPNINGNSAVRAVMQEIRGEVQPLLHRNESSLMNLANAAVLGPLTEVHKMLSPLAQCFTQMDNPVRAAGMVIHAVTDLGNGWAHAKEGGVVIRKPNDTLRFTDSHLTFAERMNALASSIRAVYTVGGLTERFSVGASQAAGEYMMPNKIASANRGNATDQKLMKWLDPTWEQGKEYDKAAQQQLASTYATLVHGTKDARTLPAWALDDNIVGSFFKIMNWNVAQTNNFFRHAWQPAMKGDLTPLLMTTLGATLGGYAIRELRQRLAGKESNVPSLSDIAASSRGYEGNIPALMYNWISAASYGGLAGIVSLAAKYPLDIAFRNQLSGAFFPLDSIVSSYATSAAHIADALVNDPTANILDLTSRAFTDIIFHNTQLGRVALNQTLDSGKKMNTKLGEELQYEKELSDRLSQLRRFKNVEGIPVNPADDTPGNPYLNIEQKQFKHTEDLSEAVQELPDIVSHLVTKFGDNPEVLMQKLRGLKENNYSVMPDIETSPRMFAQYLTFLDKKLGPDKANALVQDYLQRRSLNQAKAGMVP